MIIDPSEPRLACDGCGKTGVAVFDDPKYGVRWMVKQHGWEADGDRLTCAVCIIQRLKVRIEELEGESR